MSATASKRVTVDVLDTLPDEVRAEVIDGELVPKEAASFEHGDAQSSLAGEIKAHFRGGGPDGRGGWWIATEATVVYDRDQSFLHDVAGWRKTTLPQRPQERRISVRPDWVCEVLSTNRRHDLVTKRRVLHEKQVPHYWIVDLAGSVLTVLRHQAEGYLIVTAVSPGERARLEPFDAVELDVARLFGDLEG